MISSLVGVYAAGALASLSPCVYPLLPITLGFFGTQTDPGKRRWPGVLAYALGQALAFSALGFLTVYAGETLGFTSESRWVNLAVGATLAIAGGFSFAQRLPRFLSKIRLPHGFATGGTVLEAALLGAGSALIASPCTTPILAGVLALMAGTATLGRGVALMLAYSLGFSSLFLALGLGLVQLRRLPRAGAWLAILHRAGAAALAAAGAYYLFRGFRT